MRCLYHLCTIVGLLFISSACASVAGAPDSSRSVAAEATRVQVTNHNWSDMNVYLDRGGMRVRLGTVTSMAKQVYRVPESVAKATGEVRLIADPVGSQEVHVTGPVQFWPGQLLEFTIENHLAISSVSVWD